MAENKNLGIDLELDETVAQGNYSNLARYESVHGQIVIPTPQHTGDQFGGKIGEA